MPRFATTAHQAARGAIHLLTLSETRASFVALVREEMSSDVNTQLITITIALDSRRVPIPRTCRGACSHVREFRRKRSVRQQIGDMAPEPAPPKIKVKSEEPSAGTGRKEKEKRD